MCVILLKKCIARNAVFLNVHETHRSMQNKLLTSVINESSLLAVSSSAGGPRAAASEAEGKGGRMRGAGRSSSVGFCTFSHCMPGFSRGHVCPLQMQQQELAQMRQREANLTALAAIGPRKKRKILDSPSSSSAAEVTLVTLRFPRGAICRGPAG